jgi:predicted nuclease with TOPRIM domain
MGIDANELQARIDRLRERGEQLRRDSALLRELFDENRKDAEERRRRWDDLPEEARRHRP